MESIQDLGKREGKLKLVLKVKIPPQFCSVLTVQQLIERNHLWLEYVEAILCNDIAKSWHNRLP
jgi:hypothetical protein